MATAKGVASRERMLDAAIGLMRHGGLAAAGMNEIVAASGAPKGSVYHHFPDGKRQLAAEALDRYAGRIHALFEASLAGARRPGDKVRALFRMLERRLEEADFGQSCAVGAVTLDLDAGMDAVRVAAGAAFDDWRTLIAAHFDIPDRRRCEAFAGLVLTAIQGGYVRGRAERSVRPFREAAVWLAEIAEREARPAR
jgi:TetR/AcrR family transcriptional repressor of lmrAB and yxaGH operons